MVASNLPSTSEFTVNFAIGGIFALQNSILHWSSDHRIHHKHVDKNDIYPYSAKKGFWYSPIGWMLRDYHESRYGDYTNVRYLQKDKTLSSKQCDKLISILSELQINGIAEDNVTNISGDDEDIEENCNIMMHAGKELAPIYGVAVKQYKSWKEINFGALIDFLKNEFNEIYPNIEGYFSNESMKSFSRNYGNDMADISINRENNCLMILETREKKHLYVL